MGFISSYKNPPARAFVISVPKGKTGNFLCKRLNSCQLRHSRRRRGLHLGRHAGGSVLGLQRYAVFPVQVT
jgi:hypothetical protein